MPGMRGCYSGGISAMSTNGPISISMQALKIPQISQGRSLQLSLTIQKLSCRRQRDPQDHLRFFRNS